MPTRPTPVVFWLAGAIVLAHLLVSFTSIPFKNGLVELLAVIPARYDIASGSLAGMILPLFGHVFLHGDLGISILSALHLGMNMLVLVQVAGPVAWRLDPSGAGGSRFLLFFFASAIAGALGYILINPGSATPAIGASGAVCGVFAGTLLASGRTVREAIANPRVRSAGLWFLAINVGLAAAITTAQVLPVGIAWEAHLGGFVGGLLTFPLLAPRLRQLGPWD